MESRGDVAHLVRFGTFEVDLGTGELRKNGVRLKLGGVPFQVLAVLLEKPNTLITREEFKDRLWPDTFVDFDHGLNTAINKIREALSDPTENPRFIETVPRRGYRFIASLNGTNATASSATSGTNGTSTTPVPAAGERPRTEAQLGPVQTRSANWRYSALALAGAFLISAAILGYVLNHRAPPRVVGSTQVTNDAQRKTAYYAGELFPPIVSDGSRLYFVECGMGTTRLMQVSAAGGETTAFPTDLRIRRALDVSADGRSLLALDYGGVQLDTAAIVLALPAGAPHRLGEVVAHDATWSHDGKQIAYAKANDLYVSKADGSEPRRIAEVPDGTAWWPRWSPDGSMVRFTVQDTVGTTRLWEVSAKGGNARPLFPDDGPRIDECCGNWTQSGKYFVYQSGGQIWATREGKELFGKSGEAIRLTSGPMSIVAPVPSADGKRIFAVAVQSRGQLVRFNGKSGQFVPSLSGSAVDGVDFSRDGQWVSYVTFPEGALWRSRADGSERLQLTLPPMKVALPRWSPDGKRIAFVGVVFGKPAKIYVVDADGRNLGKLFADEKGEGEPTWSPDRSFLAFAPWPWQQDRRRTAISIVDLKTGRRETLSESDGYFSARWSPDGRYIAALKADPSQTLALFDRVTMKREALAKNAAYPNWSHDGSYLYFEDPYTREPRIHRVRISDRRVEEVANLNPAVLGWSPAGKWTGLTADDSVLVLRDTSVEEIYAFEWDAP